MRKNMTRNALVTSIISLLLCVSMLVSTTFAWFTDEVNSGMNTIAAGNLDVELYHDKANEFKDLEKAKVGTDTLLFTDVNGNEIKDWEPGVVAYTNLKVANVGTLALKYQLAIKATEMNYVEVDGVQYTLADALQVAVVGGGVTGTREEVIDVATQKGEWAPLKSFTESGNLDETESSQVYGIVVYWQPGENDFDNIFNINNDKQTSNEKPLTITLGVELRATQQMYEKDSFGKEYDENAWVDGFDVYTEQDLNAALNNGETNIDLMDDVVLTKPVDIPAPAATTFSLRAAPVGITINLNGKTITAGADGYAINNEKGATVTLGNGEIKGVVYNAAGSTMILEGGTYTAIDKYAILNAAATMTINGATVNGTEKTYPIYSYNDGQNLVINDVTINGIFGALNAYGKGTVEINGGTFNMTGVAGMTSHVAYFSTGAEVVINGGSFNHIGDISMSAAGGGGVCAMGNAKVTVNGGTFSGDYDDLYSWSSSAVLSVKGGTFAHKPAKVAAGYKTVTSNGQYLVVSENAATTTDELVAAINAGKTEIELIPGEYALRFTNNTNFNLNNTTIKGLGEVKLAISSSEAWYGRVQASNVTFENIHFTSTVGATGKATYNDCTFDSWTICASSNKEETYFNNCDINGCLNTSTDFSSGDVFAKDCKIAKAEYSGSMTMNFENCQIGEMIIWNANTNLTKCDVTTLDQSNVTTAVIRIDGIQKAEKPVTNVAPAPYQGELYDEGANVVSYKDMELTGDAYISIDNNASVAMENVKADVNGSVIVMEQYQPAIYIYGSEFTIDEGEYLIDASKVDGGVYQIFLVNVKVNGEYLTQQTAANYLNNVNWFQALQATNA